MGFYLIDNPPVVQQGYPSRTNPLTGGVLIHTTESVMDTVGPDTGAENVADFIRRRNDYGSYHVMVDSDSVVPMFPDYYTAFHCAAPGFNSRTWGISFACRTTDLNIGNEWTQKAFKLAAAEIVGFWKRNGFDPISSARFRPASELLSGPGLTTHGDAQPADRSDAFTRHPQRPQLEALLLSEIFAIAKPNQPTPESLKKMSIIANDDGTDPKSPPDIWWVTDGQTKRRLLPGAAGHAQAKQLVATGLVLNKAKSDGTVDAIYAPYVLRGAKEI